MNKDLKNFEFLSIIQGALIALLGVNALSAWKADVYDVFVKAIAGCIFIVVVIGCIRLLPVRRLKRKLAEKS